MIKGKGRIFNGPYFEMEYFRVNKEGRGVWGVCVGRGIGGGVQFFKSSALQRKYHFNKSYFPL